MRWFAGHCIFLRLRTTSLKGRADKSSAVCYCPLMIRARTQAPAVIRFVITPMAQLAPALPSRLVSFLIHRPHRFSELLPCALSSYRVAFEVPEVTTMELRLRRTK